MNRKTLILLLPITIILAAAVLWLTLVSPGHSSGENIVLKAADDHELTYPTTQGLIKMGDLLKEWTRGRITVQVYPSAQLGSEKETIEQTQLGAIDINRVNINPLTQTEPSLKVFSLPYLFRDAEHMHKVVDGPIGREMLDKLKSSDLIGLGYYDSGQRSFYNSVHPIRSVSDLEGLKIRVQKAEIMQDLVRAVGAEPIRLAFEEVYTGLQTGVITERKTTTPLGLPRATTRWQNTTAWTPMCAPRKLYSSAKKPGTAYRRGTSSLSAMQLRSRFPTRENCGARR